jgi:hypothetical protein
VRTDANAAPSVTLVAARLRVQTPLPHIQPCLVLGCACAATTMSVCRSPKPQFCANLNV